MKTTIEKQRLIESELAALPERELFPGYYIDTVDSDYVTVINTWQGGRKERYTFDHFFDVFRDGGVLIPDIKTGYKITFID